MDYILQVEKIIGFLKFNFDLDGEYKIEAIKRKFNKDLNLLGCFIKDFLILKTNNYNIKDENIYNDFVLLFESNENSKENFLQELNEYGEYYLMIVFEEIENIEILSSISTINLCFNLETYPLILKILHKYFNDLIDNTIAIKMLKSLANIVLYNFENISKEIIKISDIKIGEDDLIVNDNNLLERIAV